jgi:hypothetical protein
MKKPRNIKEESKGKNIVGPKPVDLTKTDVTKLKNLPVFKTLKLIKNEEFSMFLSAPVGQRDFMINQWQTEKKVALPVVENLKNAADLFRITNQNASLVEVLSKSGVLKTADLIGLNKSSLAGLLKKNKIEIPGSQDAESYADELLAQAESLHPSAFFMNRVIEKPQWLDIDESVKPNPSKQFKEFYEKNKDFDLLNEPVLSLSTGSINEKIKGIDKPTPQLITELTSAQQALLLSSNSNMAALLFSKQMTVRKAVTSTTETLMRELGIDDADAFEIKEKAQAYHEVAMNGYLAYRDIFSNQFLLKPLTNLKPVKDEIIKGIGRDENWKKVKEYNGLKDIDSIEDLFGPQNYCECESCRSVLSPAAYFVDLMRFTEQRVLMQKKEISQ